MVLNTNLNRVEEDGEIKRIRVSSLRGKRWSQFRFREIRNVHGIEKKLKELNKFKSVVFHFNCWFYSSRQQFL